MNKKTQVIIEKICYDIMVDAYEKKRLKQGFTASWRSDANAHD